MPVGENLISNAGFESDVTGWTAQNAATLTRDTGTFKVGAASLKVARGSANLGAALTSTITVTPGTVYLFGAWAHAATSSGASLVVRWYDASAASISTSSTTPASSTLNGWAWLSGVAAAPSNAASANIELSVATSNHCFFDAVTLRACVPLVESAYTEPSSTGSYASGAVSYVVNGASAFLGDCKVYDMDAQTDGTLSASSYTRVYGKRHNFTGDTLLDNGLVRVWLKRGYGSAASVRVSCYVNGAWQSFFTAAVDTGGNATSATIRTITLKSLRRGSVEVETGDTDGNRAVFTLRRGWYAVKVKTTRNYDAASVGQDFELDDDFRWVAYNASTVLKDHSLSTAQTTVAGSSLTEPFALGFSVTKPYYAFVGMASKPTTLYHDTSGEIIWRLTGAATTGLEKSFWIGVVPWQWLTNDYHFKEAEGGTTSGGSVTADASASGGSVMRLNANGETVDYTLVADRDLPLGDYTLVVRGKASSAVASDETITVVNTSDSTTLATSTVTFTTSYAFYAVNFSLAASDTADNVRMRVAKATATANNVDVDYFLIVPRKRNSASPSWSFFPIDLARNALMDTSQRESVRRA